VASQGTEAALFGLFWPGIPTKSALGAPLEPLFRQFQGEVLGNPISGSSADEVLISGVLGSSLAQWRIGLFARLCVPLLRHRQVSEARNYRTAG
jgi:hypothetical protein